MRADGVHPEGRRLQHGRRDLNPQPADLESAALPTELRPCGLRQGPGGRLARVLSLLRFPVQRVGVAVFAVLLQCERFLPVAARLGRLVVASSTLLTAQGNLDSCRAVPISHLAHSRILVTTPAPTVRPPSRMAKRICSSRATVVISSISIVMLSPGMTIFTPSGSCTGPVTSVVRM